jgi:hypothetical protein
VNKPDKVSSHIQRIRNLELKGKETPGQSLLDGERFYDALLFTFCCESNKPYLNPQLKRR